MSFLSFPFGLFLLCHFATAQLDINSILFTNPKIDNARATQIFDLLLKRQEYASLATATIEPRFLLDIRVPASEAQLQQQLQIIQDSSIKVEIGPDYIYGPSFFPSQNRARLVGFDLNAQLQNDIIRHAYKYLTSQTDDVKMAYLLDDAWAYPMGFLDTAVGQFLVYHTREFSTFEEAMSQILRDGAKVIVVNIDQEHALRLLNKAQEKNTLQPPFHWLIFNAGLTLTKDTFNVSSTNFYAVELAMNGRDFPELTQISPPLTQNDLLFRDMAVVGLERLATVLSKVVTPIELITSTLDSVELTKDKLSQTWNFYSYIQCSYNAKSVYVLRRTPNNVTTGNLQPLKPIPTEEELLNIMRSKPLRLGTIVAPPLVKVIDNPTDPEVTVEGPVITLATTLLKRLNVSYTIEVFSEDIGPRMGRKWTGIFDRLEEWDVDMLASPLSVSENHRIAFQSSSPYQSISYKFMYKEPSLSVSVQIFQFMVAFSGYTWLVIFISAVVVAVSLALLHKISPNSLSYGIHPSMIFIFGYLVQGVRTRPPNRASSQLLIAVWWFFCLVIVIAFCANYAAYRSFTALQTLPTSLSSLMHQNYYKYAYINGSNVERVIRTSFDPDIYAVNQMINTDFKSDIPANRSEGINEVLKGHFALIDESPFIDYYAPRLCLKVGGGFLHETYSFYMPEVYPFFNLIEDELKILIADGTVSRIFKEAQEAENENMGAFCGATIEDQALSAMRNPLVHWSDFSIEFDAAFGIFIVCLIGLIIVLFVVGIECCLGVYKKKE